MFIRFRIQSAAKTRRVQISVMNLRRYLYTLGKDAPALYNTGNLAWYTRAAMRKDKCSAQEAAA